MHSSSCFVAVIDLQLVNKLKSDLEEQGFVLEKSEHTFFRAKKEGISCILYKSGKLTVQGKKKDSFILYYLEPEILRDFSYGYPTTSLDCTPRIGVDEAGKGDVFGPLCICALYADEKKIEKLAKIGVKDSKKFSDKKIFELAKEIKTLCPHHLLSLFPSTYNSLYLKFQNLNLLLSWGHATALSHLIDRVQCRKVVIDQFGPKRLLEEATEKKKLDIDLVQKYRGEEDIVVAAASILARDAFVSGIHALGVKYELSLPKGASSQVKNAIRSFCRNHSTNALGQVAKLHFKTIRECTEP